MTHKRIIERELDQFGIRLNKIKPDITVRPKEKGGIAVVQQGCQLTKLDKSLVISVLKEYKILNAEVVFRGDYTVDDLIDVIEGNRHYVPALYVMNKIDSITIEELELLSRVPHYVMVSSGQNWNYDELLERIWSYLGLIRIYTKPRGKLPDYDAPVVLPRADGHKLPTVEEFCRRIHKTLVDQFSYANVWGTSVKFQPQKVGINHVLHDEDVVQIVKKI